MTPTANVQLSAWEMIWASGPVVKFVLLVLILSSILTWTIVLFKWFIFKRNIRNTQKFLDYFWSGKSMDLIYKYAKKQKFNGAARLFQAGYIELQRVIEKEKTGGSKATPHASLINNLERSISRSRRNELYKLETFLPFLATVGSVTPFIGLFGTVWGIMNSFQSIGLEGGASLDVVAPGIAEALIATAIGLASAIPAVIGYNYFLQKLRRLKVDMDSFGEDFLNIVRRNFLSH